MISNMSPKRKRLLAEIEQCKRKAVADLYYFDKYVLGYNLMVDRVHVPFCRFAQREIPHSSGEQTTKLILMPRGSFKSVGVTIGYTLWRLVRDPNLTVLITNEKLDKSKAFLKEIKAHIEMNERFKMLFGDWSCEKKIGKKWSESRIDIAVRKVQGAAPTVEASSVDSSETGKHVQLLICDDLVGKSNYATPEQLDKTIEYWKDLGAVLNPDGEMIVIGTLWDDRDLYNYIMEVKEEMGEFSNIEIYIKDAMDDNGKYLFPERLSPQFLKAQRIKMGAYFFGCQYRNKTITRETALIKHIEKFDGNVKFDNHNTFVTLDLAYTDSKRSDSTAIIVNSVDCATGKWYIRHCDDFKTTDPDEVIEKMFEIEALYKPIRWGIEKNNYISWLKKSLLDAMRERGIYLNIDPEDGLPHYGTAQSKTLRLRKLGPQFNTRMAAIQKSMIELEDQLLRLTYDGPRGHDDLIDALAMQGEIAFWGNAVPTTKRDNEQAIAANPRSRFASEHAKRFCVALDYTDEEREDEWLYA